MQNVKSKIRAAIACVSLLFGSLAITDAAHAACTTTYPVPPAAHSSYANYPRNADVTGSSKSNAYDCAGTTPEADTIFLAAIGQANGVTNTGTQWLAQVFTTNKVRVYVYANLAALNTDWGTSYSAPAGQVVNAVTETNGQAPNIPVTAVGILETNTGGTTQTTIRTESITNHELGHVVDWYYGFPSTSNTSYYTEQLNLDITAYNALTRAQALEYYSTIPTACQSASTNWAALQCVDLGGVAGATFDRKELFANIFGSVQGQGILDAPLQSTLTGLFTKSRQVMKNVENGISPVNNM